MRKDKPLKNSIGDIHSLNSKTNTNLLTAILESSPNIIIFALDTSPQSQTCQNPVYVLVCLETRPNSRNKSPLFL